MLIRFVALLVVFFVIAGPVGAETPKRFALLIGNASYTDEIGPLKNPIDDIALIGGALERLGFVVRRVENANLSKLYTALNSHTRRVRRAGEGAVSFFYYSGHGAQGAETRTNYLIPVDVASTLDSDIWDGSLQLSIITQ